MKNVSAKHRELNEDFLKASLRFFTGSGFYLLGRHIEKETGRQTVAVPMLLFGSVMAPLIHKTFFTNKKN